MTDGVDISKVDKSIFDQDGSKNFINLKNFTGEQKAAVLEKLNTTKEEYLSKFINPGRQIGDGVNPNPDKAGVQLQNDIDALSSDQDVQDFISSNQPISLQNIVYSNKTIQGDMTKALDGFKKGDTLNEDLAQKDMYGKPVSTGDALGTFVSEAGFYQSAMGQDGKTTDPINLTDIAKEAAITIRSTMITKEISFLETFSTTL